MIRSFNRYLTAVLTSLLSDFVTVCFGVDFSLIPVPKSSPFNFLQIFELYNKIEPSNLCKHKKQEMKIYRNILRILPQVQGE